MTFYLFLCNHLPIHPDVNRVIFDLYYNTFPRPEDVIFIIILEIWSMVI
jgi:hypothetical protein